MWFVLWLWCFWFSCLKVTLSIYCAAESVVSAFYSVSFFGNQNCNVAQHLLSFILMCSKPQLFSIVCVALLVLSSGIDSSYVRIMYQWHEFIVSWSSPIMNFVLNPSLEGSLLNVILKYFFTAPTTDFGHIRRVMRDHKFNVVFYYEFHLKYYNIRNVSN